jgi:hypothetical protein
MDGSLEVRISSKLAMVTRIHPVARLFRMGPRIAIDGVVVSRAYKEVTLQLPEGTHTLEVWIAWMLFRAHPASLPIEIVAGQTLVARYHEAIERNGRGRIELGEPLPPARAV